MWRSAGILLAMLALAPAARADVWRGQTDQGRPASVMTGGDGVVSRVRLSWRAPCESDHRYASASVLLPPFSAASDVAVQDSGAYRTVDRGGYHARVTLKITGQLGSDGWAGTPDGGV